MLIQVPCLCEVGSSSKYDSQRNCMLAKHQSHQSRLHLQHARHAQLIWRKTPTLLYKHSHIPIFWAPPRTFAVRDRLHQDTIMEINTILQYSRVLLLHCRRPKPAGIRPGLFTPFTPNFCVMQLPISVLEKHLKEGEYSKNKNWNKNRNNKWGWMRDKQHQYIV